MADQQPDRRALWALLGVAAIGAGVFGYQRHRERAAAEAAEATRRRAGLAWANMQQCLIGGKLREVPSLAARVRRIELAQSDGAWPGRCAEHVSALFETLEDGPLKQELRERFSCDQACDPHDPAVQLSGLHEPAARLPAVAPTVPAPPMLADAFIGTEQMPELAPGDARVRARDYLSDGSAHYLFDSEGKGLSLCAIIPDVDGKGASRCTELSLGVAPATAQLAPTAEEPIIVAKRASLAEARYFDASGREVALHRGRRNGFTLARIDDGTYSAEHVRAGEVTAERRLKVAEGASAPLLVRDVLLHTEDDGGVRTLVARRLSAKGEELSMDLQRMGSAGALRGAPQLCVAGEQRALLFGRTRDTWRMVFVGKHFAGPLALVMDSEAPARAEPAPKQDEPAEPPKPPSDPRQAALEDAKKFGLIELLDAGAEEEPDSEPWEEGTAEVGKKERNMWAEQLGGSQRARRAPLPRYAFNCDESTATVTWRSPSKEVEIINEVRCSAEEARCVHRSAKLTGLDVKIWWTAVTLRQDGSENVLLVWRDGSGLVRTRLAPLDQLAGAEDVRVLDSAEHGGPTTLDLEALYGSTAAVFLFRGKGFHALRFGADGSVVPLGPTSW